MRLVDEVDQLAFAVGLPAIGRQAELRRGFHAEAFDIGERCMAILFRLPYPQHVEVRAVEDIDRRGRGLGHPDSRKAGGRQVAGVIGNNGPQGKP
jgi:hypothetical protein